MQVIDGAPSRPVISDRATATGSGYAFLAIGLAGLIVAAASVLAAFHQGPLGLEFSLLWILAGFGFAVVSVFLMAGLYVVQPNQSAVIVLFGKYVGTENSDGFRWTNPLATTKIVSRRTNSLETSVLKVNDGNGTPIEVAAAVMWRVRDSARAALQVEDYHAYVRVQAEASVRAMANTHPYDHHDSVTTGEPAVTDAPASGEDPKRAPSLLGGGTEVADHLRDELSNRLAVAGIVVEEARITHLAYAAEIAPAMLRRQQAQAIIAARRQIVMGAVGMVKDVFDELGRQKVDIEEDRRAALISNLMVVLVSDRDATPVLPTGSVY